MRWTAFLPLIVFVAILGAFVFGLGNDPSQIPSVLIDEPAPEFNLPKLPGIDSPALSRADLEQGKPVIVNFFASWCAPCRAEHPILEQLAAEHDITVYGVAYKDRPEDSKRFLDALGNPFTAVGVDLKGKTAIDFGVYGVPETFIIRGDGRIAYRNAGPLYPAQIEEVLLPIMRKLDEETPS